MLTRKLKHRKGRNNMNHKLPATEIKQNYYALLIAIITHKTVSQALIDMGLMEGKVMEQENKRKI